MTWPRNPRIDRSKLYRPAEPAIATYQDTARIAGEDLTLADLRHLVRGTEGWPANASIRVYNASPYGRDQAITVRAHDAM